MVNTKTAFFAFVIFLLSITVVHAQEKGEFSFFAAPALEIINYGRDTPAIGGGITLGGGGNISMGISLLFFQSFDTALSSMETNIFLRFSLRRFEIVKGLFVQVNAGAVLFFSWNDIELPARAGTFSTGIAAGWTFPLGERFYVEPYLRLGYPYYGGIGVSAGIKF